MGLAEVIADPSAKIEALHFYTFNQFKSSEAWAEGLAGDTPIAEPRDARWTRRSNRLPPL